jgi:anti-sigma regulatory factor (Ser/Thr protein kinase)
MSATSFTVPANLESLTELGAFVTQAAAVAGLSHPASYNLRLALEEFATNAITHGGAAASGSLVVRAEMDPDTLSIILEDCGAPFDPRQVPAPADLHLPAEQRKLGGLGIFLALQGLDQFSYERIGDRNRNILIMHRPSTQT